MKDKKTITLPDCKEEVDLKTKLTWGAVQKIESSMASAAKMNSKDDSIEFSPDIMMEMKFKLLEAVIIGRRITGSEETQEFTREWMEELSVTDGDFLYAEVEKLDPKKK